MKKRHTKSRSQQTSREEKTMFRGWQGVYGFWNTKIRMSLVDFLRKCDEFPNAEAKVKEHFVNAVL